MTKILTIEDLIKLVGGSFINGISPIHDLKLSGVAPIETAGSSDVAFLIQSEYMKFAESTNAGIIITAKKNLETRSPQLLHPNPYWAFAKVSQYFAPSLIHDGRVSPAAVVSQTAKIASNVTIGAYAVIDDEAEVGHGSVIYPGVFIGKKAKIGAFSELRAHVVVEHECMVGDHVLIHANTVIGSDGFGFAPGTDDIAKIPQVGRVIIGNDVEIGAATTIDRGAMGDTTIGRGVKIDSAVHIAHNVQIGEHSMVCGGTHVAGSAKIGKWNILAGASNVTNHVRTADRVTVGGMAGVTKSITEPGEYMGFPATPVREWRRQIASLRGLEELAKRVAALERCLSQTKP